MPPHRSYADPEYRAACALRAKGNTHGRKQLQKLAENRRVLWTEPMHAALFAGYRYGRATEFLAVDIGVARDTLTAEMDRLRLPRGRWVSLTERLQAANRAEGVRTPQTLAPGGWGRLYPAGCSIGK